MTDTDREMLELAAKAAGIDAHWGQGWESDRMFRNLPNPNSPLVTAVEWSPLTDDGDALRLAAELEIDIEWCADGVAAYRRANANSNGHCFAAVESSQENRAANARLAVTRVAAEIGRNMK